MIYYWCWVIPIVLKEEASRGKQKNCEIDFIATKGNKKFYIQSALNMDGTEKEKIGIRLH